MTERPINLSAEMVQAILEGRKTQTRKVVDIEQIGDDYRVICPLGKPGDYLWVREAAYYREGDDRVFYVDKDGKTKDGFHFKTEECLNPEIYGWEKRPAVLMPRWASRITLEITELRIERLQDISESDAEEEGTVRNVDYIINPFSAPVTYTVISYRDWFAANCDKNYGKEFWKSNPYVWVIKFKRIDTAAVYDSKRCKP